MISQRAETSVGFRRHDVVDGRRCWCRPELEPLYDECGMPVINADGVHNVLIIHRDVRLSQDTQPRMTVFSR